MVGCNILVNVGAGTARVKVTGRATFAFGQELRDFLVRQMENVEGRAGAVRVELAHTGAKVRSQLACLGIDYLFAFSDAPVEAETWEPLHGATTGILDASRADVRTMVAAHEALGAANPANVSLFRQVMCGLKLEASAPQEQRQRKNG